MKMMTPSVLLLPLLLAGCASPAPYTPPVLAAGQVSSLPSAGADAALRSGVPAALWWTELGDARLETLIQSAWQNNHDLRAAQARLASARAQSQAAQGARWPGIALEGQVSPTRWQAALDWELDLFGRVAHGLAAAQASAEEHAALHDDARRLILARVVEAYLTLRGAQMLGASLHAQLENQAGTLQLVRERERSGSAAPAERLRVEAQLGLVQASLPGLAAQERAARNRLATLTGHRLDAPELAALERPVSLALPHALVTDEPARLLLRRPDVRAAERSLAVAAARAGIAHADLFPRIRVSALLGGAGRGSTGAAGAWTWFDGGAGRARVRAAGAEVEAARAGFDKVVALALEETDTAISSWLQLRQRSEALAVAHGQAQEGARLTRLRYREGAESLLGVLDSERIALAAEEQLVGARHELMMATARAYVAMAGGVDAGVLRQR